MSKFEVVPTNGWKSARSKGLWFLIMRQLLLAYIITLGAASLLHAQSASPTGIVSPAKAIYTPKPVYRPEWVRQGLAGKGVVLVTSQQRNRQSYWSADAAEHRKQTT
jgi:hypothetical protein